MTLPRLALSLFLIVTGLLLALAALACVVMMFVDPREAVRWVLEGALLVAASTVLYRYETGRWI